MRKLLSLVAVVALLASCMVFSPIESAVAETTTVYVASTGSKSGDGSEANPYESPYTAMDKMNAAGITDYAIVIMDDVVVAPWWGNHAGHNIRITGLEGVTLDFTNGGTANTNPLIGDNVTFDNIELVFKNNKVFCGGHTVTFGENVTFPSPIILGGGTADTTATLTGTNLTVLSGSYQRIYGAGVGDTITGDTNLYVGGTADITYEGNGFVFGGGNGSKIGGRTNVTFADNATAKGVFGGNTGNSNGVSTGYITGGTNLTVAGGTIINNVFGGGMANDHGGDVNLTMTGGVTEGLFGGSENQTVTGNVTVRLLGGQVTRRVYGGSYNDYGFGWSSDHTVSGDITLYLGDTNIDFTSTEMDTGIFARSRANTKDGSGQIVFVTEAAFNKYGDKLNNQSNTPVSGNAAEAYHYYTYTASGATITQACAYHTELAATATMALDNGVSLTYTGKEIKPVTLSVSGDWECEAPTITYSNNVKPGTATASITAGDATATLSFDIAKSADYVDVTICTDAADTTGMITSGNILAGATQIWVGGGGGGGIAALDSANANFTMLTNGTLFTDSGYMPTHTSGAGNGFYYQVDMGEDYQFSSFMLAGLATEGVCGPIKVYVGSETVQEIRSNKSAPNWTYAGNLGATNASFTASADGAIAVRADFATPLTGRYLVVQTAGVKMGSTVKYYNWLTEIAALGKAVNVSAPTLTATAETIRGKADGTITGLTTAMEISTDGTHYTAVTDTAATFAAGTYYVRYAATETANASAAAEVTVGAGRLLKITFRAEGAADIIRKVEYNATLTDIPAVPALGVKYTVPPVWSVTDFANIQTDLVVNAVYPESKETICTSADDTTGMITSGNVLAGATAFTAYNKGATVNLGGQGAASSNFSKLTDGALINEPWMVKGHASVNGFYFQFDMGEEYIFESFMIAGGALAGANSPIQLYVGDKTAQEVYTDVFNKTNAIQPDYTYADGLGPASGAAHTANTANGGLAVRVDFAQPLVGQYLVVCVNGGKMSSNYYTWISEIAALGKASGHVDTTICTDANDTTGMITNGNVLAGATAFTAYNKGATVNLGGQGAASSNFSKLTDGALINEPWMVKGHASVNGFYFQFDMGEEYIFESFMIAGGALAGANSPIQLYVGDKTAQEIYTDVFNKTNAIQPDYTYADGLGPASGAVYTANTANGGLAVRFDFTTPLAGQYLVVCVNGGKMGSNYYTWISEIAALGQSRTAAEAAKIDTTICTSTTDTAGMITSGNVLAGGTLSAYNGLGTSLGIDSTQKANILDGTILNAAGWSNSNATNQNSYYLYQFDMGDDYAFTSFMLAGWNESYGAEKVEVFVGSHTAKEILADTAGAIRPVWNRTDSVSNSQNGTTPSDGALAVRKDFDVPMIGRYMVVRVKGLYGTGGNAKGQIWISEIAALGEPLPVTFPGGQVRNPSAGDKFALRFAFDMTASGITYETANSFDRAIAADATVTISGKEYAITDFGVVVSLDLTDDFTLADVDNKMTKNVPAQKLYDVEGNLITYTAVVTNIPAAHKSTPVYARPYIVTEAGVLYGATQCRSVQQVLDSVAGIS